MMVRLALFEPEIPQNTGTLLRLGACLGIPIDVIEPCGFVLHERRMRRAGMDYVALANMTRYDNWDTFYDEAENKGRRLILIDPSAQSNHLSFSFTNKDTLILGKESNGFPEKVHTQISTRLKIPMYKGARSLNVAIAGALVAGEALRQIDGFPK